MTGRVVLVLLALLGAAPAVPAQVPIRLMSFNIRYGTANDGANSWENRRALALATIADHAPHILGLQEALHPQVRAVEELLPNHRRIGVGRDDGAEKGEYSAIMVDTVRFRVESSGTFWLSDTPDVPGSMHWGNRITRITTWARLVDRFNGTAIRVYNLHWDHESQPSRERSAALLRERIGSDREPGDLIVVMGDFNSDESNPAYVALMNDRALGLRDSYRIRHPAATMVGTFHGFRGGRSGGKIDHVLLGPGWDVLTAGIDHRGGPIWPSDHYPVWALVEPAS